MKAALLILLCAGSLFGANITNSTSVGLQNYLTNAAGTTLSAGDTLWLRASGSPYSPPDSNSTTMGALAWTVDLTGATNNWITVRAYPGESVKLDRQWRFGNTTFARFIDLEFYDSQKGHNPTNGSFPNGPWLHFDGSLLNSQNEWVNCLVHDVDNAWSGGTGGNSIRGCIIWYVGLNDREHVAYSTGHNYVGNISAWSAGSTIQLGTTNMLVSSNIMFGCGVTAASAGKENLIVYGGSFSNNVAFEYNSPGSQALYHNGGTLVSLGNKMNGQIPAVLEGNYDVSFFNNTVFASDASAAYPGVKRNNGTSGTWLVNDNTYYSSNSVRFENVGVSRTFAQWKSDFPGFDTTSTSTDSTPPSDSVAIFKNQDQEKRAHIAIYNWSGANNVSVNVSGVLLIGDTYSLYSAQNYGTAITSGTYVGAALSVPMTNLGVATILYGTNWSMTVPTATSPVFGAFVLVGQAQVQTTVRGTGKLRGIRL